MGFQDPASVYLLYVAHVSGGSATAYNNILGSGLVVNYNPSAVNRLFGYAISQGYTGLILYDIDGWVSTSTSKWSAINKAVLKDFIVKCHAAGLKVGVAVGPGSTAGPEGYVYDAVIEFNNTCVVTEEKFDFIMPEDEFFNYSFDSPVRSTSANKDHSFLSFKSLIASKRNAAVAAGLEFYLYDGHSHDNGYTYGDGSVVTGGSELSQLQKGGTGGTPLFDIFFLHDYVAGAPRFNYVSTRMGHFDTSGPAYKVGWIASAETSFSRGFFAGQSGTWSSGGSVVYPLKGPKEFYEYITKTLSSPSPSQSTPTFQSSASSYPNATVVGLAVFHYQQLVDDTHKVLSKNGSTIYMSAGSDQAVTLPVSTVSLSGFAYDDLLPNGNPLSFQWTLTSGPSGSSFSSSTSSSTLFTFTSAGNYVCRLTVTDGGSVSAYKEITITVSAPSGGGGGSGGSGGSGGGSGGGTTTYSAGSSVIIVDVLRDVTISDNSKGEYIAIEGQSIYDICLQTYGHLKYLYKLILENGVNNTNQTDFKGRKFIFDSSLVVNTPVYKLNIDEEIIYTTLDPKYQGISGLNLNVELEEDGSYSLEESGSISARE